MGSADVGPPATAIADVWACDSLAKAEALVTAQPLRMHNFVSGAFDPASGTAGTLEALNPKTGRVFAQLPNSSAGEVEAALQAATAAFPGWSQTAAAARSAYLAAIADDMAAHRELFAVWESVDQGKTLARARVEVDRAVANFRYFATYILHQETAARMIDGVALTYEHRSAAGVFALVAPWNMPLYLLTWKMAPCLAFGCTAVAKPSEVTSMTAFLLAEVLRRARLPAGVMNVVFGDGPRTGSALVRSPLVHGVSFTGGTATGIQIRRDTADQIYKHLSLELGGKNPTLVFADVDLDQAVATAATAAFENQGEICLCGSRIYVHEAIYEPFVAAFTAFVQKTFRPGSDRLGAVVSLPHYRKIRGYLQLAAEEKATFVTGRVPDDDPRDGFWIEPVVLTGVAPTSRVMREEIFGPVATILPFATEAEAVALANDNPNGLAAVLLTRDGARMRRVGEQLQAGMVWVNCWLVRQLGTPFGGMKNSGTGREGGAYSREVFTVVRTLHIPM